MKCRCEFCKHPPDPALTDTSGKGWCVTCYNVCTASALSGFAYNGEKLHKLAPRLALEFTKRGLDPLIKYFRGLSEETKRYMSFRLERVGDKGPDGLYETMALLGSIRKWESPQTTSGPPLYGSIMTGGRTMFDEVK